MSQRPIIIVVTGRASWARVQTVVEDLVDHDTPVTLILAGSAVLPRFDVPHPELNPYISVIRCMAFEPHGQTASAAYTGHLTAELASLFAQLQPRAVVVIADRYETLAVSIAAAYQGIPLVHLLGGERSGNIDDKVRFANTMLADYHCVATEIADELLRGIFPFDGHTIHQTGCPSVDLALRADFPDRQEVNAHGVGATFYPEEPFIVGMYHPCTEDDFDMLTLLNETRDAARALGAQVLWFWPNIDPGAEAIEDEIRQWLLDPPIRWRFFRHLPPEDFLGLLKEARCLIGNSSVGVRETAIIGVPTLNIGLRQCGRETGPNVAEQLWPTREAIAAVAENTRSAPSTLYGDGTAGAKIGAILRGF